MKRVNKSKISENKAPKFKLNFNNININNDFNESHNINNNSGSITTHTNSHMINQISTDKKNEKVKKKVNSDKKKHISKINITNKFSNKTSINIQLNHNCKTNTNINININNLNKKLNNNKYPIKNFNKINVQNLGYKTERINLKGNNISNTQKKIINKNKSKNNSQRYIKNKKVNQSIYEDKVNSINAISNISKYFNIKGSNFLEKGNLTDRFIVKINNKLKGKEKGIKMKKNITHNSNSPFSRREINNQIYNNYIQKKKKEKNPIKLVQNNKEDTGKYSVLSDNQKNNVSNGNNNSNLRNFYSNDSNIEEFSLGQKKIYKVKGHYHQVDKLNPNNKNEKERINKYLKNINLIKKLINNNNNKNSLNEKTFNKDININNQNKFYQALKKMNILPDNTGRVYTINLKNTKQNKFSK